MKRMLGLLLAASALAQEPRLSHARIERQALIGTLDATMRDLMNKAQGPEWAAYAAPAIAGQHETCGHWLEGRGNVAASGPVLLEGPALVLILFRLENHAVDKIRVYAIDCELDAGGLPVHLIQGVTAEAGVSYLETLTASHKSALMAIAMHAGTAADRALDRLASPQQPEKTREEVAFWAGSARGAAGVQLLKKMARSDPSERVRDKVMFGLSISKDPGAVPLLIASARQDASGKVRGQALFWLAQKAGKRETEAITKAVDEDPDLRVKKQAVFALQQLPRDEGIPLLIQVARTNKDPQVRKQAMFWLGQTNDPRAVKFFEDVLLK